MVSPSRWATLWDALTGDERNTFARPTKGADLSSSTGCDQPEVINRK
jgi:hypothetical protein